MGASLAGGLPQLGYPCIVGAGNNAAILHYERNNCQVIHRVVGLGSVGWGGVEHV